MSRPIQGLNRYALLLLSVGILFVPTACTQLPQPPTIPSNPYNIPPLGLYIVGNFNRQVNDLGGGPATFLSAQAIVVVDREAEIAGSVTLTTPSEVVGLTYSYSATFNYGSYGSYSAAYYVDGGSNWVTYTPGANYTMAVSTSIGSATTTAAAPGDIDFSANGASVTWQFGNFASANVTRLSPSPASTYVSTSNINSPFTFPGSAYSSPSLPATFWSVLAVATTVTSFSGSTASGSAFIWIDTLTKEFTR